jgi:hypothetical protein
MADTERMAGYKLVETANRGAAALRWVDRLRGKKVLQVVVPAEAT